MKSKTLLLFCFLIIASVNFAQNTAQHEVFTTLTEIRHIFVNNNVEIPLKRSISGNWKYDETSELVVHHDLLIPQKVTVHTLPLSPMPNAWQGRSLRVEAVLPPGTGWGPAVSAGSPIPLITAGTGDATGPANAQDAISNIGPTQSSPGMPGPAPAATLVYSARAQGSFPPDPANDAVVNNEDSITVVYTLADQ